MPQPPPRERLLLRISEVSEIIGLAKSKTYQLVKDGSIPSVRIDSAIRIRPADLKRWLETLPEGGKLKPEVGL